MTAAIQTSLTQLGRAVENLETSVSVAEVNIDATVKAAKSSQHELFSAPSKATSNSNGIDPKILAGRLDSAIEKVEQILRQG